MTSEYRIDGICTVTCCDMVKPNISYVSRRCFIGEETI